MGWHYDPKTHGLTFALNGNTAPKLSFYDAPPRLVVDLPGVQLARSFRTAVKDPDVMQVRAGQINQSMGRLVLELSRSPDMAQVKLIKQTGNRWRIQLPTLVASTALTVPTPRSAPLPTPQLVSVEPTWPTVKLEDFVFSDEGFLIRTTGPTEATVRRLDGPPRLVVDLPGTILPTQFVRRVIEANRLGVRQVRLGQFQARPPITRIVLDVGADTWDWEAAYDPKLKGVRLVPAGRLALTPPPPSTGTNILSASLVGDQLVFEADGPLTFQANWNYTNREYQVQFAAANLSPQFKGPILDMGSPLDRLRLFPSEGQTITAIIKIPQGIVVASAQRQRGNRQFAVRLARMGGATNPQDLGPVPAPVNGGRPLIFVDAGHGGSDPGALGVQGIQEKDINLRLALLLGKALTDLGYRVGYTRQDDRFIPLQGRVDLAEQANADLFISLHQNASDSSWAQGIETYFTRSNSATLAATIHRAAVASTGRPDRGVRQARFHVIRQTTMPAILLEGGYVTNATEMRSMMDDDRQQKLAQALARSIDRYLRGKR